ncbi:MAG: OmpH family outer membrane protein [Legionellales bacterium]|nr:OmpH family outer membrane protein [Legionellales bacterium]
MKKLIVMIVSLTVVSFSYAKDFKIGVVDFQKVILEAPAAKKMNNELQKKYNPRNSEIIKLKEQIEKEEIELQKNESIMTPEQVEKKRMSVLDTRRNLERKVEDFQRDLQTDQAKASKKFSKRVELEIEKIGEKGSYDIIFQKQATVFVKGQSKNKKEGYDITEKLIKALN